MKGFSYLYAVFFVGFLSTVVVSYFTGVSTSYLSQKRILNESYYDSISREFLSMVANQIIKKINFVPFRVESLAELGIFDNSLYYLEIGEIRAKVRLLIKKEELVKSDSYNKIKARIILYSMADMLRNNKIYSSEINFVIISGHLPFNMFASGKNLGSVKFFFPYHNPEFYRDVSPEFEIDRKTALKSLLKLNQDEDVNNSTLRKLLKLKKSDMPVVDGLYIGESDNGNFLYLKGEVERLILGIDNDFQFIYAEESGNRILIKFKPEENNFLYLKNEESGKVNGAFSGNILVEGNIQELSSGKIVGSDIVEDSEVDAVKDGVNLNIFVGGGFKVYSSLKYEGISLKKGKFVREKTKLNLIQSDRGLFYDNSDDSEIEFLFSENSPEIHANIFLKGRNYTNRAFSIFGSIFSEYPFLVNPPDFTEDPLNYIDTQNFDIFPLSTSDITILKSLNIEKIEEVF